MPAYVDESARVSISGACYVLAAVLVPSDRADEVRGMVRGLRPPREPRLHWHKVRAGSRPGLAAAVRALDIDAVVVATRDVRHRNSERARRRCLVRLLWELDQRAARDVVFETRKHQDADDRRVIAAAVRAGQVGRGVGYAFVLPTDEPLLWLPDVVAGAAGLAVGEGDSTCLDLLGGCVSVVTLP
jgi:hypothetical protein